MSADPSTKPARPRVAILIVNGFRRRGRRGPLRAREALEYPWIDLCLRQIERHSQGWDYQIFIFDNSHFQPHRATMAEYDRVSVRPSRGVAFLGRIANRLPGDYVGRLFERRHPHALDYLAKHVPASFDYIVTLDNDSFPISGDWLDVLVAECEHGAAVAGVYRDEMAPALHPFVHVSGLCVRRDDLRRLNVSFGRSLNFSDEQDSYNQDVGQKITYEFIRLGRTIAPLPRSNKVNYHFLLGGIYGDVIYHHGAAGRATNFWGQPNNAKANKLISDRLREAAFQDIDQLVAVLQGKAVDDLGLTALAAVD